MGFAMASKSLLKKEKWAQFASRPTFGRRGDLRRGRHERAEKTLSILAETISRPDLSIFMSTAPSGATPWKGLPRRFKPFAITTRVAARLRFCSPQRRRRSINSATSCAQFETVFAATTFDFAQGRLGRDLSLHRLPAFMLKGHLFQRPNVEHNERNSFGTRQQPACSNCLPTQM